MKTFAIGLTPVILIGVSLTLVAVTVQSIQRERRRSRVRKIWPHFGLSIAFCALFFVSWIGQGVSEWQTRRAADLVGRVEDPSPARGFVEVPRRT